MTQILTITLNPTVDISSQADIVRPTRKTRTSDVRYDPGGGINAGIAARRFAIAGQTRVGMMVCETGTDLEYRFVPEGPAISHQELRSCVEAAAVQDAKYVVASGSLPAGAPDDTYTTMAQLAAAVTTPGARTCDIRDLNRASPGSRMRHGL